MQSALARKLDVVVRAQNIPKNVVDLLTMLVAHASDTDCNRDETSRKIHDLDVAIKAPTSDLVQAHDAALREISSLRQQTLQLEHTIREAQASLLTHLEMKQAQLRAAMHQIQEEAEMLLREAIPNAMQQHLHKFASDVRRVGDLAVAVAAKRLRDNQQEYDANIHDICLGIAKDAVNKAEADMDALSLDWRNRIEEELQRAQSGFRIASMQASDTVTKAASDCVAFLASRLELSNTMPLEELHEMRGEIRFCQASARLMSGATASIMEVRELQCRVKELEQSTSTVVQAKGVMCLFDIDDDVAHELGSAPGGVGTDMKLKYIESLPMFSHIRGGNFSHQRDERPSLPHFSTTPVGKPPVKDSGSVPRDALLRELSGRKPPPTPTPVVVSAAPPLTTDTSNSLFIVPMDVMTPQKIIGSDASASHIRESLILTPVPVPVQPVTLNAPSASVIPLAAPSSVSSSQIAVTTASVPLLPLGLEISDGDPLVGGVNVCSVAQQSVAEKHGLAVRDVVVAINGAKVRTREEFAKAVQVRSLKFTVYRPETAKVHTINVIR